VALCSKVINVMGHQNRTMADIPVVQQALQESQPPRSEFALEEY
jgi:hypothetical protein